MQEEFHLPDNSVSQYHGCPYFGLAHDPDTKVLFPTPHGACHAGRRPTDVDAEHQKMHCLNGRHTTCPIFAQAQKQADGAPVAVPTGAAIGAQRKPKTRRILPLATLVLLLLLCGVAFWIIRQDQQPVLAQSVESPTVTVTPTPISPTRTTDPEAASQRAKPNSGSAPAATLAPTQEPTAVPPTATPTDEPTAVPTTIPTRRATATPEPTREPTAVPTIEPSPTAREWDSVVPPPAQPPAQPTAVPTTAPPQPTAQPTAAPTAEQTAPPQPTRSSLR